jgi:hypothetical protein
MDHQSAPALGPKWPNAATIIAEDHFLIRSGSAIMIATAATATARSLFAATKSLNRRCSVKVAIQLLPLTSAARSAPPPARRRAARRRSSVGGRVPVLRAAAACALWLVGLV